MLTFLAKIYTSFVQRRNDAFNNHKRPIVTINAPVISVGNILAGGTGKTPVVQYLVRELQLRGYTPAVVLRGYRRSTKGLRVVHNGERTVATVAEAGDEAYLHATALGVVVVVCEDKVEAARVAVADYHCDVVVVDDGYQHRSLHRDVDIVMVDNATVHGSVFPVGRLREPLTELSRAHIVVCTKDVYSTDIRAYVSPHASIVRCSFSATPAVRCDNAEYVLPPGSAVYAVSGIAQPERFAEMLRYVGYRIEGSVEYRDHHHYTEEQIIRHLAEAADCNAHLVTTSKDAVKILPLLAKIKGNAEVYLLPLSVQFSEPGIMECIIKRIQQ